MRAGFLVLVLMALLGGFAEAGASDATAAGESLPKPPTLMQIDRGVFRGVQPETAEDYAALKKAGIHTILNFRWDKSVAQSRADAEAAGFKFVNVPINAVRGPRDSDVAKIFEIIEGNKAGGILFHCTLGRDRTGLIAALYRVKIQGVAPEKAYEEWTAFGFSNAFLKNLDAYFWKVVPHTILRTCEALFSA